MNSPKPIQAAELMSDLQEKLDEIELNGAVFLIATEEPLFNGDWEFVMGSYDVCSEALGLIDEEYGWPDPIEADAVLEIKQLTPDGRRHPLIEREGLPMALAIQVGEFDMIRKKGEAD